MTLACLSKDASTCCATAAGWMAAPTGSCEVHLVEWPHCSGTLVAGILLSHLTPVDMGARIPAGDIGEVRDASTSKIIERLAVRDDGEILLLTETTPAIVTFGNYSLMTGRFRRTFTVFDATP